MNIDNLHIGSDELRRQEKPLPIQVEKAGNDENKAPAGDSTRSDKISVSQVWNRAAGKINVRAATPRQILDLSRALYDEGAISYDDHLNLSFQPEINSDLPRESQPFSHEAKDYLTLWKNREQNSVRFGGGRAEIEEIQRIQAILTYVDSLR